MSYYAVLSATSALLTQHHFAMRRCMRRFNGPHRYVLFDMEKHAIHIDTNDKHRRMGYTLRELLEWLTRQSDAAIAQRAQSLLQQFEASQQFKSAS